VQALVILESDYLLQPRDLPLPLDDLVRIGPREVHHPSLPFGELRMVNQASLLHAKDASPKQGSRLRRRDLLCHSTALQSIQLYSRRTGRGGGREALVRH
jgi:hypothetical protein